MTTFDLTQPEQANAVAGACVAPDWRPSAEAQIGHFGAPAWEEVDLGDLDADAIRADAERFDTRWRTAVSDATWMPYRMAVRSQLPLSDSVELARVVRAAESVGSVMAVQDDLPSSPSWGWPLRVFFMPDSKGGEVAAHLRSGAVLPWWFKDLVELVSMQSPTLGGTVDVAFIDCAADVRRLRSTRGLRVNALIVVASDPRAEWVQQVGELAKHLGSVALLIPDVVGTKPLADWLLRFIEELSHRNSLDVAMGKAAPNGVIITSTVASAVEAPLDHVRDRMRTAYAREVEFGPSGPFVAEAAGAVSMTPSEIDGVVPAILHSELSDDVFGAESDAASEIRSIRHANDLNVDLLTDDDTERYLQAAVSRFGELNVRLAFRAGEQHEVNIWVGRGATGFLRALTGDGTPFTIDHADLAAGTQGEIVIWGEGVPLQSRPVLIGEHKTSDLATFHVDVPKSAKDFEINLALVLGGRIVQGGAIRGPVTPKGGRARRAGEPEIEFVVGPQVVDINDVGPELRSGIVTLIEHGGLVRDIGVPADDLGTAAFERKLQEREIDRLAEHFGGAIALIVGSQTDATRPTWFASARGARRFAELANKGFAAFKFLVPFAVQEPDRLRAIIDSDTVHLAVFGADEGRVSPELLYDREPPPDDAAWCDGFDEALETGICPVCLPWNPMAEPQEPVAVCPAGFWGVRKEIERVVHRVDGEQTTLHNRPRAQGHPIAGLDRFQIGVSSRVDQERIGRRNPTTVMSEILDDAGLALPNLITDWDSWRDGIALTRPQVLVLLSHSEGATLELGTDQTLKATNLRTSAVRQPFELQPAGPIVLLVGCDTAITAGLSSFAEEFRTFGASVVIGTSGTTLGRFAAPIAAELVATLNDPNGPATIGSVLLQVRRRTLAKGWITGLLMMAFTDGAYRLERSS